MSNDWFSNAAQIGINPIGSLINYNNWAISQVSSGLGGITQTAQTAISPITNLVVNPDVCTGQSIDYTLLYGNNPIGYGMNAAELAQQWVYFPELRPDFVSPITTRINQAINQGTANATEGAIKGIGSGLLGFAFWGAALYLGYKMVNSK